MKDKIFARMDDMGWGLSDFNGVYEYHKEVLNYKWRELDFLVENGMPSDSVLRDTLSFITDMLDALDEEDKNEGLC